MATGNSNFDTLITTTLQDHGREIFDAVSTNNSFYFMAKQAGNIKIRAGGRKFTHPIIYAVNSSFKAYPKLGTIDIPITDNITRAEYDVKVMAGSIVLGTIDLAMNAGDREKLLDLADEKKLEAEISMTELMGDQVFKDGSGANDFGGLDFIINDTPSAQTDVGGIDPSAGGGTSNAYWQNFINTSSITAFNTGQAGLTAWNDILNNTTFGRQGPKAIFTTKAIYQLYELGLTGNIRYARTDLADAGFRHLQFTTMPVLFDDNATTGKTYFVDMDSLWLQVLAQANMEVTQFQLKVDQLVSTSLMYIAANITTGSRRTQGKQTDTTG